MDTDNNLLEKLKQAKEDTAYEDEFIKSYLPFIKSETAKFLKRSPDEGDDELSIAMIAFHEAIQGYDELKGGFFNYASTLINSRLIDNYRKEKRHSDTISIHSPIGDTDINLEDTLADDYYGNNTEHLVHREATKKEIWELVAQMHTFGVSLSDVSMNCPRQQRNKSICLKAMQYAKDNPEILEEFLRTKKLPLSQLSFGSSTARKTLERHRKYLIALLLICTNGYEIIRDHLSQVLKGGVSA